MIHFIDEHREAFGVEPICDALPIAPATYYAASLDLAQHANSATPNSDRRSGGSTTITIGSTGHARCGGS